MTHDKSRSNDLVVRSRKAIQTKKNEWKNKFTKIGMIIKYLRTLSINEVCVPYAYSMHVRALAALFLKKIFLPLHLPLLHKLKQSLL
jgi:hypothetical protein